MADHVKAPTAYSAFKKCLIDAWPRSTVSLCASMIMLDFKIENKSNPHDFPEANFIKSIGMPAFDFDVSTYIAAFYTMTSEALFNGASKDLALRIFMKERANPRDRNKSREWKNAQRKESMDRRRTVTIRARELTKAHDWKTVK